MIRKLALFILSFYGLLLSTPSYSQTLVYTGEFPLNGAPIEIDLNAVDAREIRVYSRLDTRETRPILIALESGPGLAASMFVSASSKSRTRKKLRKLYGKSWPVSFTSDTGKPGTQIRFNEPGVTTKAALGFIQADACNTKLVYTLELVLDLRNYHRSAVPSENIIRFAAVPGDVPGQQQTLFKYPSEKGTNLAVLLMKTMGGGTRLINVVSWSKGYPRILKTFPVGQFFYSNQGVFTRTYIPASSLNGATVTLEHISYGYTYGVCAKFARKRQQLEGYRK